MSQRDPGAVNSSCDPDELPISLRHPTDGRALRYHVDELAVSWLGCLSDAIARTPQFIAASRVLDPEMLRMHIENALHPELMPVCRAYMRRQYLRLIGQPSLKPVTCPAELFDLVGNHWLDESIPLVARRSPITFLRTIVRMRHRLLETLLRITRQKPAGIAGYPVVAVEIAEGADPLKKSDAFWLGAGMIKPQQILFVFERQNKAFLDLDKELSDIGKLGAKCVALHRSVDARGRIPLWLPGRAPPWFAAYCRSLNGVTSKKDKWLRKTLKEFAEKVWRWEAFLRHFNVAVYQQFSEFSSDTAARRLALDRVGGIQVGKMRSQFFDSSSAAFYFQHEVAFVWHGNVKEILKASRTRTREVVSVGYLWDHLFESMACEATALRKQLMRPGIRYVLTVFDNAAHPHSHFSWTHLEKFYVFIADLVEHRPEVALIVKSKKPELLRKMPHINAVLCRLEAGGRCVVVNQMMTSVVPAALAADIVVAIPASTAACEAALGGRSILMYDPGGSQGHPFSGRNKGIVHNDFDVFSRELKRMLSGAYHPRGNAWRYLDQIDAFRDGNAARRAGAYIAGFLDAKTNGLDKQAAMEFARYRYSAACDALSRTVAPLCGDMALSKGAR